MEQTAQDRASVRVSIIVPVYRTEAYLKNCLDSLLIQTHRAIEILLVDDGSDDGCPAVCDAYAARDQRVKVIHKPNGGVSAARNDGIDAATGDFIGFVDSDDWVEPDYVEGLLNPFFEHPEIGVSICGWFVHDHPYGRTEGGAEGIGLLSPREAFLHAVDLGKSYDGYLWNKLFRAEIFRKTRLRLDPSISICEDLLLCAQVFSEGHAAYYSGVPLYHYLYRETSALRTYDEKRASEYAARERIAALAAGFDRGLYHAAELGHVKSALSNLAVGIETHNPALKKAMRKRVNARILSLVFARDLPLKERLKLPLRWVSPSASIRLWRKIKQKT